MQLEVGEEEGWAKEPGRGKGKRDLQKAGWTRTTMNLTKLESPNPSLKRKQKHWN
jgi:hypothetical protein